MGRNKQRKYVSLKKTTYKGRQSRELLDPEGDPIIGFTLYMHHLIKKEKGLNSRSSYARHLSQFFDYLYEVALLNNGLTELLLEDACEEYETYMILGKEADYELAAKVAKSLPSPCITPKSYDAHHAAMQGFLRQSGRFAKRIKQLEEAGYKTGKNNSDLLLFQSEEKELSFTERRNIIYNSVLASTISGGAHTALGNLVERRFPSEDNDDGLFDYETDEKAFPWDSVQALLDAAPSYREKAFWSLQAATGCRYSEALQILWEDIDFEKREVKLIDPKSRIHTYHTLKPEQIEKLVFKSRATPLTFMIQPWAGKFFKYLLEYQRSDEYRMAANHDFVFQSKHDKTYGEPYCFNSYQGTLDIFKRAAKKAVGTGKGYGLHSLRHMYGIYLANDALTADGKRGFPLTAVQTYMGHKDIKTTRKYARKDKERVKAELQIANDDAMDIGGPKTTLERKIDHAKRELDRLLKQKEQQVLLGNKAEGDNDD
ncbi:MAG: tyrosine-type recombinase/integrase [Neptuniibacter sp.]